MTYTLLIHGGAGNIQPKNLDETAQAAHRTVLETALEAGAAILEAGGSALDAVEAAVRVLEDSPLFNAGRGAVFTADETQEMDACIMEGTMREAGAVTCVSHLRNPVTGARKVLAHSPHVLLSGATAEQFARDHGADWAEKDYFFDSFRWGQLQEIKGTTKTQLDFAGDEAPEKESEKAVEAYTKFGTVGAVACDSRGHLAAATSTGGLTNKQPGRIGDSPIIGAGCYADDRSCAVSCTGQGEYFMRGMIAGDVAARMLYGRQDLEQAAKEAIHTSLDGLGGKGGLIAVDAQGNYTMPFNTTGMFRGIATAEKREVWMFRS